MVVVIDSSISGISGDMLLCALVDLGADTVRIRAGIGVAERHLPGSTINRLDFVRRKRHGIRATCLELDAAEDAGGRPAAEVRRCIEKSLPYLQLSDPASGYALDCIDSLISAESRIHGAAPGSVHLHEAASIDTVVDILGCAMALDHLGLFDEHVISTTVAVGGGTLDFSHGPVSNPAPAILEIFKNSGLQIRGGAVPEELTTPTGACLLANLAKTHREFYPPLHVESVGYGGGTKDFESFANVLKIVRGKTREVRTDSIAVLETNTDDTTGEILGGMVDRIMTHGAKDVTVSPAITKKNRPTNLITVMCADGDVDKMVDILMRETGSLGVRVRRSDRFVLPRTVKSHKVTLDGTAFDVRVKTGPAGRAFKIEFDDVRDVSYRLGLPLREAEDLIRNAIKATGG